ncbi:MAG: glycosyltransferase family 9 protein, partial [Halofilum sp. (in: g-proteobacteria)]
GQTSPKGLLSVLAHARVAIAPDTGPLHIAAAAGTPVIGLFATSNPDRTGPVRWREWTVNRYPEAVRAEFGVEVDQVRWGLRVRNPEAMRRINVDDVTRRLDALLTGAAPPAL